MTDDGLNFARAIRNAIVPSLIVWAGLFGVWRMASEYLERMV